MNSAEPQQPTTILVDRLLDGTDQPPRRSMAIDCSGGRIDAVRPARPGEAGTGTFEFADHTAVPGLVDAHTHLVFDASIGPRVVPADTAADLKARATANARAALQSGVTTVCDVGGPDEIVFGLRDAVASGRLEGPRIVAAGRVLTSADGHGAAFGRVCAGRGTAAVRAAVRSGVEAGSELIKVMVTGGGSGDAAGLQFPAPELVAIADEAHRLGLRVAGHCHGTVGIAACVAAGFDRIEHATFMTSHGSRFDAVITEQIVNAGIVVCPTNAVDYRRIEQTGSEKGLAQRSQLVPTWRALVAAGVTVIGGSDAGVTGMAHNDYALVPRLMVDELKMSPTEAIRACTSRAAAALGLGDDVGTLTAGSAADIVVVAGDATRNVAALQRPTMIMRAGRMIRSCR